MKTPMIVDLPPGKADELLRLAKTRDIGIAAGRVLQSTMELLAAEAGVPLDQYRYLSVVDGKLVAKTQDHILLEQSDKQTGVQHGSQ